MSEGFNDDRIAEITKLLQDYFDGLYDGDLAKFNNVFHENSHLYASDGDTLIDWPRSEYFNIIKGRESPSEQGLARHDQILSIHMSGPNTALATVKCAIPPRYFTDYLTLLKGPTGWRIISKTFHTDTRE